MAALLVGGVGVAVDRCHICSADTIPAVCVCCPVLQVPPPPAMDPAHEEALHTLMEVGYGAILQKQ